MGGRCKGEPLDRTVDKMPTPRMRQHITEPPAFAYSFELSIIGVIVNADLSSTTIPRIGPGRG